MSRGWCIGWLAGCAASVVIGAASRWGFFPGVFVTLALAMVGGRVGSWWWNRRER